jgi:hypothetical protein
VLPTVQLQAGRRTATEAKLINKRGELSRLDLRLRGEITWREEEIHDLSVAATFFNGDDPTSLSAVFYGT